MRNQKQVSAGMLFRTPENERVLVLEINEDGCILVLRRFGEIRSCWFGWLLDRIFPRRVGESWERIPEAWVQVGTAFEQGKVLP